MKVRTQVKTQTQQVPVEILKGPAHRDDGYQMREDYGLPLSDASYARVKGVQGEFASNAEQYRSGATEQLNSAVKDARDKLAGVSGPGGFREPPTTTLWAGGDGDKPYAYKFPTAAMPDLMKSLHDTNYYGISGNADGSYAVQFKEYGKEGYEALNEAQSKYQEELAIVRNQYNAQASAANAQISDAKKAIDYAEAGGRDQIENQYQYLAGLFGRQMAEESTAWMQKMQQNSEAVQNLVAGGVLTVKTGRVI